MMKKKFIITVFASLFILFNSKGQVNIRQINSSEFLSAQFFQLESLDISSITQLGNYNTTILSQTKEGDLFSFSNSSNSFQHGDFNSAEITQKGNENVLLSFQLGYLSSGLIKMQVNPSVLGVPSENFSTFSNESTNDYMGIQLAGTGNKLTVSQEGTNNRLMAIQQGNDNSISAEQNGTNNYLVVYQNGKKNVTEFLQGNNSDNVVFDTVIQQGEELSFSSSGFSQSKAHGNTITQSGFNLSLQVNNEFANTLGDIEISQTGRDMKVVVDQSYFSFQ